MRVKDLFYTIVISIITSSFMIGILISVGILQTQMSLSYEVRQSFSSEFSTLVPGRPPPTKDVVPVQNVTNEAISRMLHICVEFDVTYNSEQQPVQFYLWLIDDSLRNHKVAEIVDSGELYCMLSLDKSVSVNHAYSLWIWAESPFNISGTYYGTVIQDAKK